MSFIHIVGQIASDLELKISQKGTPYVRFNLTEHLGNGRKQIYQVWAYDWEAERLSKWNLKPGAVMDVNGPLFVEEYTAEDGFTPRIRLKVIYRDGFRCPTKKTASTKNKNPTIPADDATPVCKPPAGGEQIDGERQPLPE